MYNNVMYSVLFMSANIICTVFQCLEPGSLFPILSVNAKLIIVFDTFLLLATRYIIHRS